MSKGQRGNKETKKPKKAQPSPVAPGAVVPPTTSGNATRQNKKP